MELKIKSLFLKGDEKEERLVISVLDNCQMNEFIVMDNTYLDYHSISDEDRNVYIFPRVKAKKGEIVILHSSVGEYSRRKNGKGNIVHRFYWGLERPIWNDEGDCAYLIKISEVDSKCVGD